MYLIALEFFSDRDLVLDLIYRLTLNQWDLVFELPSQMTLMYRMVEWVVRAKAVHWSSRLLALHCGSSSAESLNSFLTDQRFHTWNTRAAHLEKYWEASLWLKSRSLAEFSNIEFSAISSLQSSTGLLSGVKNEMVLLNLAKSKMISFCRMNRAKFD